MSQNILVCGQRYKNEGGTKNFNELDKIKKCLTCWLSSLISLYGELLLFTVCDFPLQPFLSPNREKSAPVESSKFIGRYKKWLLGFALVCRGKILNRDGLNYLPHQEIKLLSGKEFFIFTQTFIMLCIESGN